MGLFKYFKTLKAKSKAISIIAGAYDEAESLIFAYKNSRADVKSIYNAYWIYSYCIVPCAQKFQWTPYSKVVITDEGMAELAVIIDFFSRHLEHYLKVHLSQEQMDIVMQIVERKVTPEIEELLDSYMIAKYHFLLITNLNLFV